MHAIRRLFIVLLVLAGTAASSAASTESTARLVPSGQQLIIAVDVTRIRAEPLFVRALAALEQSGGPKFKEFVAKTGFDPKKDLHSIVLAMQSDNDSDLVMLFEGRFDLAKIRSAAKAEKTFKKSSYKGNEVWLFDTDTVAAPIKGTNVLVLGKAGGVNNVIDVRRGRGASSSVLRGLAVKQLKKGALGFAMLTSGSLGNGLKNDPKLSDVRRVSGFMGLGGQKFSAGVDVTFRRKAVRNQVFAMADAKIRETVQKQAGDPVADLFRAVRLGGTGENLEVRADFTQAQDKMILGLFGVKL